MSCAGCHSNDAQRAQIAARAPTGLTFVKARAALQAALQGVDLDGTETGMESLAPGLSPVQRNDLAGLIAQQTCSGPTDRVVSTVNAGMTTPAEEGYGSYAGTSMAAPVQTDSTTTSSASYASHLHAVTFNAEVPGEPGRY